MGQLATLIATVLIVVGLMAASLAGAQGLPTVNPTAATNTTDGISLNEPKFKLSNGNVLGCSTASTGTSTETKSPVAEGEFHITWKGCVGEVSGIKAKCTGLGDANTGEILKLGIYDLVYDTGGAELGIGILSLVGATHLTCAGLFLEVVSGEFVCLAKEPYVAKTLHEGECGGLRTYLNDKGETITPKLTILEGESSSLTVEVSGKALDLALNAKKENVSSVIVMN